MARISSFPTDNNVQTGDKVLGTDQSGDTKNYEIGVVGEFYAKSNLIIVSGQIGAQFITDDSAFGYGKWMFSDGGGGGGVAQNSSAQTGFVVAPKPGVVVAPKPSRPCKP